jgi:hypothetical protein
MRPAGRRLPMAALALFIGQIEISTIAIEHITWTIYFQMRYGFFLATICYGNAMCIIHFKKHKKSSKSNVRGNLNNDSVFVINISTDFFLPIFTFLNKKMETLVQPLDRYKYFFRHFCHFHPHSNELF